ncbi:MAG: hypothetical protein GY719_01770 [bacterium]|nr:hypothetical protein [bacterium]
MAVACLVLGATGAWAQTVVVDETNASWSIGGESGTPTFGYVMGPGTPPIGSGSVNFQLPAMADGAAVGSGVHNGLRLADITTLTYSTYQNTTPQAASLQFNVDYDDTDGSTAWQGRLVFEPLTAGTVLTSTWQSWDALTGTWWSTGTPVVGDSAAAVACPQGAPCTWATVLSTYPNAAIHSTLGALLLKGGSGWPAGWDGNADALHLVTSGGTDVTYDFETAVPVTLQSFTIE